MASARRPSEGRHFPEFRFTGRWRGYQQRLVDELEQHLDDRRLHVVAAPGAGKTVIGLEVLRRLGRPALVLSPTLAIRDQWLSRLRGMFASDAPDWLAGAGSDLAEPGWLVSSTYQSLHSALGGRDANDEDEEAEEDGEATAGEAQARVPDLIGRLKRAGIATLVLDEAHHLRRAWWESLQKLVVALQAASPDFHIVSLTATPPYDVEEAEWARYHAICGPIDAEISIPELVRQGDLCPHQDFVHFSFPRPAEVGAFATFSAEVAALVERWLADPALAAWVAEHPWLTETADCADEILDRPEVLGALLGIAQAHSLPGTRPAFELIGALPGTAPAPTGRTLAPLFQAMLDDRAGAPVPAELQARLATELRAIGAVWRGRVRMQKDEQLARALAGSAGKMDSAIEIARAELAALGSGLRMVILADYIRAEALRRPDDTSSDRLGAGPIFRRLIAAGLAQEMDAALVTGTTMVVPARLEATLRDTADDLGLAAGDVSLRPLPQLSGWLLFDLPQPRRAARLQVVTRLFEAGALRCLVGTASLLGEGWDAPSLNSLVLATSVKTYMLSNQMRGRAIRRHPRQPDKTAAIWHLATIIPPDMTLAQEERRRWEKLLAQPQRPVAYGVLEVEPGVLGRDARLLAQRFKAFAGVTHQPPYQVLGSISRLGVRHHTWTPATVAEVNREMLARAADRPQIATAWREAVGGALRMTRPRIGVKSGPPPGALSYIWSMGAAALLAPLAVWVLYALNALRGMRPVGAETALLIALAAFLLGVFWNWRRIWRLIAAGSPGRHLREIGRCLLDALAAADQLHTPRAQLSVTVLPLSRRGPQHCSVKGGTQHDEATFAEAMAEFLEPMQNPKHILVRQGGRWPLVRKDYHAVPAAISADEHALAILQAAWERRIGPCEIHGTRSREGRQLLLRARARAYSGAFVPAAEQLTIWQ